MATQKGRGSSPETTGEDKPSKAELQRHLEETREAIAQTVTEIKDTVSDQYEAVKDTVSGVLDLFSPSLSSVNLSGPCGSFLKTQQTLALEREERANLLPRHLGRCH